MSSTENLLNWRVFNEVVNRGGIIAASEALDCEPSTVSRIIKKLEKDLVQRFTSNAIKYAIMRGFHKEPSHASWSPRC